MKSGEETVMPGESASAQPCTLLAATALSLLALSAVATAGEKPSSPDCVRPMDTVASAGLDLGALERFDDNGNGRVDAGCEGERLRAFIDVMLGTNDTNRDEASSSDAQTGGKKTLSPPEGDEHAAAPAEVGKAVATATRREVGTADAPPQSSERSIGQRFRKALAQVTAYEPVYFLVGKDERVGYAGKFQLSLNYQLFADPPQKGENGAKGLGGYVEAVVRTLALNKLFFSYSQTSFWDFSETSGPFHDTSYRPRFYYRRSDALSVRRTSESKRGCTRWVSADADFGLGHESNGQADLRSRSIDIAFVRPTITFCNDDPAASHFYLRPTIYAYLDDSENPDISDYRGYVDLEAGWVSDRAHASWENPFRVWVIGRKGDRSDFGSLEANVAIPFSRFGERMNGWLMLQYFNGYGENLLTYNRKFDSQLRAGLAVLF